ncbi:MAG: YIP1 family protein [Thermoanaerobacteraceae bacterium]|nr:YIP1 family protein [Thermoanaerobacteraceae bacterium]
MVERPEQSPSPGERTENGAPAGPARDNLTETITGVHAPGTGEGGGPGGEPPGFLDLVYGVFFDPAGIFRRVASRPPLLSAVLIFTLVNLVGAVMGVLTGYRLTVPGMGDHPGMGWMMKAAAPWMAVAGLVFQYLEWFVFSALFHLTAGLLGGQGRPVGVLTVTALAALPSLIMVPVDMLLMLSGARGAVFTAITALLGLLVLVWSVVLVVMGMKEVHRFSTARAMGAVLLPPAVFILTGVIFLAIFLAGLSTFIPLTGASW